MTDERRAYLRQHVPPLHRFISHGTHVRVAPLPTGDALRRVMAAPTALECDAAVTVLDYSIKVTRNRDHTADYKIICEGEVVYTGTCHAYEVERLW